MARRRYATVKIPYELAEDLDSFRAELGYRSRAEAVDDAIRRFIMAMNRLPAEKPKTLVTPVSR
jgi:metal-responsive CopG/Arc/MetJ family transcriptional regulator